jgi:hypothetical protein
MAAIGGFAEDSFVLAEFAENLRAFTAELVRVGFDCADQGFDRMEPIFRAIPLGGR